MSSNQYHELLELIPDEIIERVKELSPAQPHDGIASLGVKRNGCMDVDLFPLDDGKLMVGTAYAVDTEDGDNFPIHMAIYWGKPEYVLVVIGKDYTERAYMGDPMGGAVAAIRLSGIVIDGYMRDKTGLAALDIPIYAKGFIQKSPDKKGPGEINTVVTRAGMKVTPGDLVVGDYDGVTVIPRGRTEGVLTAAEKKKDYEFKHRDVIANYRKCGEEGRELPNLVPARVTEMLQGKSRWIKTESYRVS